MQELVSEISGQDLKKIIVSSKNCRFSVSGFELLSRYSSLSIKIPESNNGCKCVVVAKRKSGNGTSLIASGRNVNHQSIVSIKPQELSIPLDESGIVTIKRPANSIGCIEICSIKLLAEKPDSNVIVKKWNDTLSRCIDYTCMKIVDDKLYASTAGVINTNGVISVETKPINLYKIEGNKIIFLGDCEVVSLNVADKTIGYKQPQPVHIDAPMLHEETPTNVVKNPILKPGRSVYDSDIAGLNKLKYENCQMSGSFLIVGHKGKVTIEGFELGFSYAVSIELKKIDGNGKFAIQLDSSPVNRNIFVAENADKKFITNITPVSSDNLSITRTASGTGVLSIKRIVISRTQNVKPSEICEKDIENDPVEVLDDVNFKGSDYSEWVLSKIPKIIHFYWGGSKLPFLRYVSIYSFIKHNPDWKVKLHVPEILGKPAPTWRTSEQKETINTHNKSKDYMHMIENLNVEVVSHNFKGFKVKNTSHEVHKSDYLRWILLSTEGGVWSDNDIIYTRPITYMIDNNESNKNVDAFVCVYNSQYHAIGFLMSSPDNEFYKIVSQFSSKLYNAREYQSIGASMFNKKFKSIRSAAKNCNVSHLNPNSVYSITNIGQFLSPSIEIGNYNMAIGFHWYGGHPDISRFEADVEEDNYKTFNNFLSKLIRYTLDG